MNHPDRVAAWLVDSDNGEQMMEITDDTKLPGSIKVILNAQDHTLGNMIRQLLLDPNVLFAGYRIPHPLQNRVEIRIQTDPLAQPFISPRKALLNACATLVNQGRDLRNSFKDQAQRLELQNRAMGATATVGQSRLGAMDGGYGGADVYGGDGGAGAYDSYMSGVGAGGAGASQQPSQAQDDPYGY